MNKKLTQKEIERSKTISQSIMRQMREFSKRHHEQKYIRAVQDQKVLFEKMGHPSDETLLRGWKEILPALNVRDKRTARRILESKGLLRYQGRIPILLMSEYIAALK